MLYYFLEYFSGAPGNEAEPEFVQNANDGFRIDNAASANHGLSSYD